MLPLSVTQYQQRIESLLPSLRTEAASCSMNFQHVFTNYLIVKTAGLVETSVGDILGEYAKRRGSSELRGYVQSTIRRENSLNCEKIEKILKRFSSQWWPDIVSRSTDQQRSAVDSIKTLRDQFAHGQGNGTGFAVVDGYYDQCKKFIVIVSDYINP